MQTAARNPGGSIPHCSALNGGLAEELVGRRSSRAPLPSRRCQRQLGAGWDAANVLIRGNEGRSRAKINARKDATLCPASSELLEELGRASLGWTAQASQQHCLLCCPKVTNLLFLTIIQDKIGSLFQLSLFLFFSLFITLSCPLPSCIYQTRMGVGLKVSHNSHWVPGSHPESPWKGWSHPAKPELCRKGGTHPSNSCV